MPSSFSGNLVTYQTAVVERTTCQLLHCHFVREWSFGLNMEVSAAVSHSFERKSLECPIKSAEKELSVNASVFINHAAIAWFESRKKWIGDQKSKTMQKDPIISWSTTYEELLSTNEPFSEPIPLPEMVDFLVDIWQDEGLFN